MGRVVYKKVPRVCCFSELPGGRILILKLRVRMLLLTLPYRYDIPLLTNLM